MKDTKSTMFYGASPILFEFAKQLRLDQTDAEKCLWEFLYDIQLPGFRFKRQHPVLFFIADFYCHKARLIIEVDGGYHRLPEQYEYDKSRDKDLEDLGLNVLRFTNKEIFCNIEEVVKK